VPRTNLQAVADDPFAPPNRSGLITRFEQIPDHLGQGEYLECQHCKSKFETWDEIEALDYGAGLQCMECEQFGAFVLRSRVKQQARADERMRTRLPMPLCSGFMPVPRALIEHAPELDLDGQDVLIIQALWSHNYSARSQITPGEDRIARLALCHKRTVIRRLDKLEAAGLVQRRKVATGNRIDGTVYSLTPLWTRLAEIATGLREPTPAAEEADDPLVGQDPPGVAQPNPWAE
jgi:DNA-binding MarR family transcriptional regulator